MSTPELRSTPKQGETTRRVIFVGIGGATCSGKTTLAKHLASVLPNSFIIHQDDFAPPASQIPLHPTLQIPDWDAPRGAIDWPRLVSFLRVVKQSGKIPEEHRSHDHLNEQKEVPVGDAVGRWRDTFADAANKRRNGEEIVWGLVDGFLLYWHPDVVAQLDVRVFLRVPHDVLKQRRHERHGYHTAEGSLWRDPPRYWEDIVYPAYIQSSAGLFVGGDIEHGVVAKPSPVIKDESVEGECENEENDWQGEGETGGARAVPGLLLIEPLQMRMDEVVERVCEVLIGELAVTPVPNV